MCKLPPRTPASCGRPWPRGGPPGRSPPGASSFRGHAPSTAGPGAAAHPAGTRDPLPGPRPKSTRG
eukprot:9500903-Pyramimonas_sp.AAC.1